MNLQQWLERLRHELRTRGLPANYSARLIEELEEHIIDVQMENQSMDAQKTIEESLGSPDVIAANAHTEICRQPIWFWSGWRRKLGILTLPMACVFIGGWSYPWPEVIQLDSWRGIVTAQLHSSLHRGFTPSIFVPLILISLWLLSDWKLAIHQKWQRSIGILTLIMACVFATGWLFPLPAQGITIDNALRLSFSQLYSLLYRGFTPSVFLPLAMVSIWLLRKKPCNSKPEDFVEPIATLGS